MRIKLKLVSLRGREYTEHGSERTNESGFDSQKIDSIIDNYSNHRTKEIDKLTGDVTWRYQDKCDNTVITNERVEIIDVYSFSLVLEMRRIDSEYIRQGTCSIFVFTELLAAIQRKNILRMCWTN